jgi:hypothetical protein
VSDKRVQTLLTYAELNELLGQTEYGAIEAVVADPVRRVVRVIFGGATPDGVEPWAVPSYALKSSPPSTSIEGSPEPTESAAGNLRE